MDLDSYTRWDDYTRCRDDMFEATDTAWAPWFIARSDNKRQARLNIISHLLSSIPYKKVPRGDVKLPKRNVARSKPLRNSLKSFRRQIYETTAGWALGQIGSSSLWFSSMRHAARVTATAEQMVERRYPVQPFDLFGYAVGSQQITHPAVCPDDT